MLCHGRARVAPARPHRRRRAPQAWTRPLKKGVGHQVGRLRRRHGRSNPGARVSSLTSATAVAARPKIVVEKHPDTYVAYPLGLRGVVVGQGETYEEALADVKSAIRFHMETFGPEAVEIDPPILEAFIAEAGFSV